MWQLHHRRTANGVSSMAGNNQTVVIGKSVKESSFGGGGGGVSGGGEVGGEWTWRQKMTEAPEEGRRN